jgi:hypothetical protein
MKGTGRNRNRSHGSFLPAALSACLLAGVVAATAAPVQVQTPSGSIFDPTAVGVVNLGDRVFATTNVTTALVFKYGYRFVFDQ